MNATSKIQIARITNLPNWYFERVVFPGQRLVFETLPHALLEIHTGMMASAIISDTIPCERLVIEDPQPSAQDVPPSSATSASAKEVPSALPGESGKATAMAVAAE